MSKIIEKYCQTLDPALFESLSIEYRYFFYKVSMYVIERVKDESATRIRLDIAQAVVSHYKPVAPIDILTKDANINTPKDVKRIYFFTYKKRAEDAFKKAGRNVKIDTKYAGLSNYYDSPIEYEGTMWKSNERAYQASKFTDKNYIEAIRNAHTSNDSKIFGSQNAGRWSKKEMIDAIKDAKMRGVVIRRDFDKIKDGIMYKINLAKYTQSDKMKKLLLSTGDSEIIEGSPFDSYWGCGSNLQGQNNLGKILMRIRSKLEDEE